MIYNGSAVWLLPELAAIIRSKLRNGKRCLYLNSPAMVAGFRSHLAFAGIDVEGATRRGSLVLSSDLGHLDDGRFDPDKMLSLLTDALDAASRDGYEGLFASGDVSWQFGAEKNFDKLHVYEEGLEQVFHNRSKLEGICQYHVETLPASASRTALDLHRACFINRTLSLFNPYYGRTGAAISTVAMAKLMATPVTAPGPRIR
jgi:hypothetical protein